MGRRERGGYAEWGWSRFDNPDGVMALGIWRGLVLGNVAEIVERYSLVVDGPLAGALPTGEEVRRTTLWLCGLRRAGQGTFPHAGVLG